MAERPRRLGLRLDSVRLRTALASALVVALALGVFAWLGVWLQHRELVDAAEQIARREADAVAAAVQSSSGEASLGRIGGEETVVQVIGPDGRVQQSSAAIDGEGPIVGVSPQPAGELVRRMDSLPTGEGDSYIVVTVPVQTSRGPGTVVVAQSLESVDTATGTAVRLLLVGCPALVLLVALTGYWLAGRALAPVDSMTRRLAAITAEDLDDRLPTSESRDEVSELARTLNAMLGRLEDSTRARQRFVADASHELRSPLTTIRAAHEIGRRMPDATDWKAVGDDVLAETARLEDLVADLLLLAGSADPAGMGALTDLDLTELVLAEGGRPRRVPVRVTASPGVRVTGNRQAVERAVRNLVDNAERHAASAVEVRLSHGPDGGAVVEVLDDGNGIPIEERERVFERFVRLDESRNRDEGGAGLGLAISRDIARAHGGEVRVLESPRGARMSLELPAGT